MNIFISYGHDSNAPLIEKIKEYLSDPKFQTPHNVWIDTSEIKAGEDWRRRITSGILKSDVVLAGLSKHSMREPGVCRDEITISIGIKGGNIRTILLEKSDDVAIPPAISHIQWLDMSDWKEHINEGYECAYFKEKFAQIRSMIETDSNFEYDGEISELKKVLKPISSISRIRALTKKRLYGRQWLFDNIEKWYQKEDSRIFWIMASPGFGKSMFAAYLQQYGNIYIPAVQFVEWGKPDHCDPKKIICNIAFYMAARYSDYRKYLLSYNLKDIYQKNEDELFDFFFCESTWMQVDGDREIACILIDALDEANDKYGNKIAETIARHIERLPRWIRFIITSRNDTKVSLPLSEHKPQIYDLEKQTSDYQRTDMNEYLRSELDGYNLNDDIYKTLIDKSEGIFLYLDLLVKDFKSGLIRFDSKDNLPNGIKGYYFQFMNRLFGTNIDNYINNIAPILQVYIASNSTLTIEELKYLYNPISESLFYRSILQISTLFIKKVENSHEKLHFFHNSIETWLTDYSQSGIYYISRQDAEQRIAKRFLEWIRSDNSDHDKFWSEYRHTMQFFLDLISKRDISSIHVKRARLLIILKIMQNQCAFGELTKEYNDNAKLLYSYFTKWNEEIISKLFIIFFETTKDSMIEAGVVSPISRICEPNVKKPMNGYAINTAVRNTAVIGYLVRKIAEDNVSYSQRFLRYLCRITKILGYYDYRTNEVISQFCSLTDLGYFTSIELLGMHNSKTEESVLGINELIRKKTSMLYPINTVNYNGMSFKLNHEVDNSEIIAEIENKQEIEALRFYNEIAKEIFL